MSHYRGLPPPEYGDEEEFEDEEEDEEDVLAPGAHGGDAPRAAISNAAGLAAALDDIAWPATTAWADTLVMRVRCFLSNTHPALLAVSQRPLAHSFVASAASAVAAAGPGSVCNIELPAAAACPAFGVSHGARGGASPTPDTMYSFSWVVSHWLHTFAAPFCSGRRKGGRRDSQRPGRLGARERVPPPRS